MASAAPAPALQALAPTALPSNPMLHGTIRSATTGLPVDDVTVFISTTGGLQQTTTTDRKGEFSAELYAAGRYDLIYAHGASRSSRHLDAQLNEDIAFNGVLDDSGEASTLAGHYVPPVLPQMIQDPHILPPYSDEAMSGDYWSKAWMLLDIDERGTVQRVKFLKHPGHQLDSIAVDTAFGWTFKPGHDATGQAIRAQLIVPIEWPSADWLIRVSGMRNYYNPAWAGTTKCQGSAPQMGASFSHELRDCSQPDISKADDEPWISPSRGR
jgi:hypothetical protein